MGKREDPGARADRLPPAPLPPSPAEREHSVQLLQSESADGQIAEIVARIEALLEQIRRLYRPSRSQP